MKPQYEDGRTINNAHPIRCRYDDEGHVYIHCQCGAKRYLLEAPQTECSRCGAHYSFWVKQVAPPIGE